MRSATPLKRTCAYPFPTCGGYWFAKKWTFYETYSQDFLVLALACLFVVQILSGSSSSLEQRTQYKTMELFQHALFSLFNSHMHACTLTRCTPGASARHSRHRCLVHAAWGRKCALHGCELQPLRAAFTHEKNTHTRYRASPKTVCSTWCCDRPMHGALKVNGTKEDALKKPLFWKSQSSGRENIREISFYLW